MVDRLITVIYERENVCVGYHFFVASFQAFISTFTKRHKTFAHFHRRYYNNQNVMFGLVIFCVLCFIRQPVSRFSSSVLQQKYILFLFFILFLQV